MFNSIFKKPKTPTEIKKIYNIPDVIHFDIKIDNGWFLIKAKEQPGLITQARTADELVEMVNDAILTYYDVPDSGAEEVFDTVQIVSDNCEYMAFERPEHPSARPARPAHEPQRRNKKDAFRPAELPATPAEEKWEREMREGDPNRWREQK